MVDFGNAPPENITVITPDGEHVVSVPRLVAAQLGELFSPGANSKLAEGVALLRERSLEGDVDKLRQSIQENPDCVSCHGELAEMLVQKGDRAGAIAEYKEVVRIMPGSADSHYMLGIQFEAEGATQANARYRYDPKSHTLRAASSPNPKTAHADYESALEQYRLAHKLAPDSLTYKQAYQRLAKKLKHP